MKPLPGPGDFLKYKRPDGKFRFGLYIRAEYLPIVEKTVVYARWRNSPDRALYAHKLNSGYVTWIEIEKVTIFQNEPFTDKELEEIFV